MISWLHGSLVHLVDNLLPCFQQDQLLCRLYDSFVQKLVGLKSFELVGSVFGKMVGLFIHGIIGLLLCYHVALRVDEMFRLLYSRFRADGLLS